jgi:transposase
VPRSIAPTYVGLDVSARSISVALIRPDSDVLSEERIANTGEAIAKLVRSWGDPSRIHACYEAGPTGYELQRRLAALGVDCAVIAPALIPKRPGEHVKTDRRDARSLCTLFRAGTLTAIRVPTPEEEAVRDLVRLREDLTEDVLRARHRLSKFLLRQGRTWSATKWTERHLEWVGQQRFDVALHGRTLREHRAAIDLRLAQRGELDREILAIAARPPYAEPVRRLCALRGVGPLTALTLLVEVCDFARFPSAAEFQGFTGLTSSERSSGERRRQGSITKAGNAHLRRVLVESSWAYRTRPAHTKKRTARLAGQPPEVTALALVSEERLHRRFWRLVQRGKPTNVAAVAVARELAGVIWALMHERSLASAA